MGEEWRKGKRKKERKEGPETEEEGRVRREREGWRGRETEDKKGKRERERETTSVSRQKLHNIKTAEQSPPPTRQNSSSPVGFMSETQRTSMPGGKRPKRKDIAERKGKGEREDWAKGKEGKKPPLSHPPPYTPRPRTRTLRYTEWRGNSAGRPVDISWRSRGRPICLPSSTSPPPPFPLSTPLTPPRPLRPIYPPPRRCLPSTPGRSGQAHPPSRSRRQGSKCPRIRSGAPGRIKPVRGGPAGDADPETGRKKSLGNSW